MNNESTTLQSVSWKVHSLSWSRKSHIFMKSEGRLLPMDLIFNQLNPFHTHILLIVPIIKNMFPSPNTLNHSKPALMCFWYNKISGLLALISYVGGAAQNASSHHYFWNINNFWSVCMQFDTWLWIWGRRSMGIHMEHSAWFNHPYNND